MAATQPTQVVPSGSNDHRPNSGLREGDISHEEVNAEIRGLSKTIIFGQQTRLRNGFLMEDEKLSRFHAGHSLVLFFYRGLHRLPDYLIDALFKNGISVTLVGGKDLLIYQNVTTYARSNERRLAYESGEDLLIFKDVRTHQTLHVGFTRKTVYIPEGFLREAINQGYASWAISSILINQCWPLLDYLLILEFIRCAQRRFRTHFTLGIQSARNHRISVEPETAEDALHDLRDAAELRLWIICWKKGRYDDYVEKVFAIGLLARSALESILNNTSRNNQARKVIRQTAEGLLKRL